MDIENIKRWHWMAIGLVIGLLLAASKMFYGAEYDGHSLDKNFDAIAYGSQDAPAATGFIFGAMHWSYLTDIVVHPPVPADPKVDVADREGLAPGTPIYWVTGKLHEVKISSRKNSSGKWAYDDVSVTKFFHRSPAPYKAIGATWPDVQAFLGDVAHKTNDRAGHFRFAWWEKPAAVWSIYPLGGLVLIGGVWPTVLGLMRGMGLGRRPKEAPGTDLRKVRSTTKATMPSGAAGLTDEERQRLDAMTSAMEDDLLTTAAPAGTAAAVSDAPVRELDTTPVQAAVDALPHPAKAFGAGDFYPTEIHRPAAPGDTSKS